MSSRRLANKVDLFFVYVNFTDELGSKSEVKGADVTSNCAAAGKLVQQDGRSGWWGVYRYIAIVDVLPVTLLFLSTVI